MHKEAKETKAAEEVKEAKVQTQIQPIFSAKTCHSKNCQGNTNLILVFNDLKLLFPNLIFPFPWLFNFKYLI